MGLIWKQRKENMPADTQNCDGTGNLNATHKTERSERAAWVITDFIFYFMFVLWGNCIFLVATSCRLFFWEDAFHVNYSFADCELPIVMMTVNKVTANGFSCFAAMTRFVRLCIKLTIMGFLLIYFWRDSQKNQMPPQNSEFGFHLFFSKLMTA